nr:hypothetical protein CFP56_33079 [Quercus suber]
MHHNLSFFAINLCYTPIAALQNLQRLFVCEAHHDLYVGTTKKGLYHGFTNIIVFQIQQGSPVITKTLQRPRNSYSREELTLAIEDYGSLNHT